MPGLRSSFRSPTPARAPVPANGYYPKLLQGASGSVWLVTGPNPAKRQRANGVLVGLSDRPQKGSHKVGTVSGILNETKMKVYNGPITLEFVG